MTRIGSGAKPEPIVRPVTNNTNVTNSNKPQPTNTQVITTNISPTPENHTIIVNPNLSNINPFDPSRGFTLPQIGSFGIQGSTTTGLPQSIPTISPALSKPITQNPPTMMDRMNTAFQELKQDANNVINAADRRIDQATDFVIREGGELIDSAKIKGGELVSTVRTEGGELIDSAKIKGGKLIDEAKDLARRGFSAVSEWINPESPPVLTNQYRLNTRSKTGDCGPVSASHVLSAMTGTNFSVPQIRRAAGVPNARAGRWAISENELSRAVTSLSGGRVRQASSREFSRGQAPQLTAFLRTELENGRLPVLMTGNNSGNGGGHYTVVTAVRRDGSLMVADSNGGRISTYSPQDLASRMSRVSNGTSVTSFSRQ